MKRVIIASSQSRLTPNDKKILNDLCEDQLYQLYENGSPDDEMIMEDAAEIVFEHVQLVLTEVAPEDYPDYLVQDAQRQLGDVAKFVRNYVFHHFDDYSWDLD